MTLLFGLLLLIWLLVSVVAQLPGSVSRFLRSFDVLGLIPSWSFFAPNPVRTDCHLMYRHLLESGQVCPWTEAFVWRAPWTRAFWNPDRRVEKAISDACHGLTSRIEVAGVQWSIPYLLVLNYVSALPTPAGASAVQFALLGSFGHHATLPPFVRFLSATHPLPASPVKVDPHAKGGPGDLQLAQ